VIILIALVDFLKNPTSYDGLESIAETHPSIKSADIYPRMRSVTDEDLTLQFLVIFYYNQKLLQKNGVVEKFTTNFLE
jgi:hypothetical protein